MKLLAEKWPVLTSGSSLSDLHMLLCHGAGGAMDSPFMERLAESLAECGIYVVRFELEYMAERRFYGKKRPPPRMSRLVEEFAEIVKNYTASIDKTDAPEALRLLAGGKSMGGRVITEYANLYPGALTAVACFGYPFHPVKRLEQLRISHFESLKTPTLIAQGTRDPFGDLSDVSSYALGAVQVQWLQEGDHDFKGPRGAALSQDERIALAAKSVWQFSSPLPPRVQAPSELG